MLAGRLHVGPEVRPADDVQMSMLLALHAVVAEVGEEAEATRAELRADLGGDAAHLTDVGPELHLRPVLLGHGEEHHRNPSQDVLDDDNIVVLVEYVRWLKSGYNVAKDTVGSLLLHRGFCDSRLATPLAQR